MSPAAHPRRVLVVNPNSNAETTAMMCDFARAELPGAEVVGATARGGPRMIVDPDALRASRRYVVAQALRHREEAEYDAIVVAAIGDPDRLERALADSSAAQIYRQYVDAYGLGYTVERSQGLEFSAFSGSTGVRLARVAGTGR